MPKRSEHAIYDLKYHLVWVPKYRKSLLVGAIERRLREIFSEIAMHHGLEIVELELMPDHVHMFVEAAPKWAPGEIVGLFKVVSAEGCFGNFRNCGASFGAVIFGVPDITREVWETKSPPKSSSDISGISDS